MDEKKIIEAKLAAEVAGNALNGCFRRVDKAKTFGTLATYLASALGLLTWFEFTFSDPGTYMALFIIPLVLAVASRSLIGTFYLRDACAQASSAYGKAVNRSIEIEQEELGKR